MGFVVNYPPAANVTVNEDGTQVVVAAAGPRGEKGDPGVVAGDSPITYDAATQTVGIDQSGLALEPNQVNGTAVVTSDSRLSDARTPTAHAASHGAGGSDAITINAAQVSGTAVVTDDARLSDSRTPTGAASGDLTGTYPSPTLASIVTAGTATKVTFDAKGRVTAGATLSASDVPTLQPDQIAGTAVVTNDARLSDARTPTAHAASHGSGGSDAITLAQSQVSNLTSDLSAKAAVDSPTFTGTPAGPTAAVDTNTTQLATTAFVVGQAGTATPVGNGTAAAGSSLRYSRQDHVHATDSSRAPLDSPTFTGTPAAPTAAVDTDTTQIATTAFVLAQAGTAAPVDPDTAAAVGTSKRYAREDHVHSADFGGSLLKTLPAPVPAGEQLLKQAVWWIDSAHSSASGQSVSNLGWGASALDARLGSASGADSNDPLFLAWEGENYVYLPGTSALIAGNCMTVPDAANLRLTSDVEMVFRVQSDDWTPSVTVALGGKDETPTGRGYALLLVASTGTLRFVWSPDGTDAGLLSAYSTVSVPFSDGDAGWIKAQFDADNGASGRTTRFYTAADSETEPSSWTQLGSDVTSAGATSIYATTQPVSFGFSRQGSANWNGRAHRMIVKDGIDGTPVLDVDCSQITSGSNTSFTALTGQTVTISRSTSGRKSVAVTHPCWLFGTDDYMEVADNALLDFGASDSFTVLAFHRPWGTQGTNDTLIAKKDNTTNTTQGWSLSGGSSTALQGQAQIGDGSAGITAVSGSRTAGAATLSAAVRDVGADDLTVYLGTAAGSAVTDTTTGSLSNSEVVRVGRLAGAGTEYFDGELVAAAIFRRALTSGEITTLSNYFAGRVA